MAISTFPNGFPGGITIRGLPLAMLHPGEVFYVNNSSVLSDGGITGSDGNVGTFKEPFKTIDYAVGQCTADRGDIIMVMPGYTQTITNATDIALDVDGIAIVGMGLGSMRPTITYGTNATANILFSGDNMSIYNIMFQSNKVDVASALTASGTPTDFTVEQCEFRDTGGALGFLVCVTGVATANATDGLHFNKNHILGLDATTATHAISLLEVSNHVKIQDNWCLHPAITNNGVLMQASTFDHLDMIISNNKVFNPGTGSTGGIAVEAAGTGLTGHCYDNYIHGLDNSAQIWITAATKMAFDQNYCMVTAAADKSALINPVAV